MARKETWGELLNFSSPWRKLWANRYFVQQITLRNIQTKFKGSFLGAVWLLVFPLLMLTIYSFVFCVVFKTRWGAVAGQQDSKMMFALMLFCGMAVYNIFSESVGGGVSSITDRVNYVKKIITPLELLPLTPGDDVYILYGVDGMPLAHRVKAKLKEMLLAKEGAE